MTKVFSIDYDPISSPGGKRDQGFDWTFALEDGELIDSATVTSSHASLVVSNVVVTTVDMTLDGEVMLAGKGITFSVSTTAALVHPVPLYLEFVGDSGSADKYKRYQPVVHAL